MARVADDDAELWSHLTDPNYDDLVSASGDLLSGSLPTDSLDLLTGSLADDLV